MLELDKTNFDNEIFDAEGYVFVDFWSEACEPCKALMPGVHELAEKYGVSRSSLSEKFRIIYEHIGNKFWGAD